MEAVEDLRLLIKLSYTLDYAKDEDQPLAKDVMLRMIPLANAYEFTFAMKDLAEAITKDMTTEEAHMCIMNLSALLHDHPFTFPSLYRGRHPY